jgi:LmbE family N-acetylglucosaminyl deacetylase
MLAFALAAALAAGISGCIPNWPETGHAGSRRSSLPAANLAGPRLLVIAPHPDDDTVGVGGAVALARERGWAVTVVFVTSGDGFWAAVRRKDGPMPTGAQMQEYGRLRTDEALRATAKLGVPAKDVIFLGFPDGSTHFLWQRNWDASTPLKGINGATTVPYPFAMKPGAPYTGTELLSELESIVASTQPTTVLLPDPADVHRDHWAIAAFAQTALVRTGYSGAQLTYLVHRSDFPRQLGMRPNEPLEAPLALERGGTKWMSVPLTREAREAQRVALLSYVTQEESDAWLIDSFIRANGLVGLNEPPSLGDGTVQLPQVHDRIYKGASRAAMIRRIDLSRSDTTATVALRLAGDVSPNVTYDLHARSIGPKGQMRFYECSVQRGALKPVRYSAASVSAPGALLGASGDSVVVALPQELLSDAQWLMVSADTRERDMTSDHASIQMVRLLSR